MTYLSYKLMDFTNIQSLKIKNLAGLKFTHMASIVDLLYPSIVQPHTHFNMIENTVFHYHNICTKFGQEVVWNSFNKHTKVNGNGCPCWTFATIEFKSCEFKSACEPAGKSLCHPHLQNRCLHPLCQAVMK